MSGAVEQVTEAYLNGYIDALNAARRALADAEERLTTARRDTLNQAADEIERRMQSFPRRGSHTRAGWAVAVLRADEFLAALDGTGQQDTP